MATAKQVSYAMQLLKSAGYSVRFMDSTFKKLGARMSERSGRVEDWLKAMPVPEASALIERLK